MATGTTLTTETTETTNYANDGPVLEAVNITTANINTNITKTSISLSTLPEIDDFKFNVENPEYFFIGRSDKLSDLENFMKRQKPPIVLVNGLGGIGKTQLVRQFIAQNRPSYNYIVWINSESSEYVSNCFKLLSADRLKISTYNANGTEKDFKSISEQVLNKLSKRKTLLVYDDVIDIKSIKELLNKGVENIPPHVIITSRKQFGSSPSIEDIQLNKWKDEDAMEYIKKTLVNQEDSDLDKKLLVDKLQAFPLALKQAIAHINDKRLDRRRFSISDYLDKCDTKEILNCKKFLKDPLNRYKMTTFRTWDRTIDEVRNKSRGELAIEILNVIAYLDANNINEKYFIHLPPGHEQKLLDKAVRILVNFSMVNRHDYVLSIFRLVQQVRKLKLQKHDQEKSTLRVALLLISKLLEHAILHASDVHAVSVFDYSCKFIDLKQEFKIPSRV